MWQSPFERSVEAILALRGEDVVVLASGDPFLYGVGATLARRVDPAEMLTIPAPSAFSLAAARLGWPLQETVTVSLHGRPDDLVRPYLHPCTRILALTSDETGPAALAALLTETGFGASELTVLEALGGERERITRHRADRFAMEGIDSLNLCAIEVLSEDPAPRILPLGFGLDDDLFEHDGQITKREIRAITLSALSPRRGERLLDIGGGSGSISIEWMLADPSLKATAVEADADRAARIRRNAARCGVPGLAVIEGRAPEALAGLGPFDAVFIGGGGSLPGVIEAAFAALRPGGRLVANAVTLEMEQAVLAAEQRFGGTLTRIDIARAAPVGTLKGWRPAMPVTQWCTVRPAKDPSET